MPDLLYWIPEFFWAIVLGYRGRMPALQEARHRVDAAEIRDPGSQMQWTTTRWRPILSLEVLLFGLVTSGIGALNGLQTLMLAGLVIALGSAPGIREVMRLTVDRTQGTVNARWIWRSRAWPVSEVSVLEFERKTRAAGAPLYVGSLRFRDADRVKAVESIDFVFALDCATQLASMLSVQISNQIEDPGTSAGSQPKPVTLLKDLAGSDLNFADAEDEFAIGLGIYIRTRVTSGKSVWYLHDGVKHRDLPGEYVDKESALRAAALAADESISSD